MSTTRRAPCPACDRGAKDRALAITEDDRGIVSYCHRCGYTSAENFERRPDAAPMPTRSPEPLEWSEKAEAIWRRTVPLRGTLGQKYLEHRGCVLPPADSDLRFLEPTDRHPPTLCARITDAATGRPISLHMTALAPDGSARGERRYLSGHRKARGCVRLWPDDAVTRGLAIGEGIETCLAAAHAYTPVWSCLDAGNLAAFPLLAGIEALSVYADNDDAGRHAARAVGERWADAGREVTVITPIADGADIADLVAA